MVVGFTIGGVGVSILKKMGGIPKGKRKGKSFGIGTTKIVVSRIYSVVRHPQYICWIFFSFAIILIQHWLVGVIGVASILTIYMQARQDDQTLVEKFGDEYNQYMKKAPRTNILLGIVRLLKRRKNL